jgi:hypothetical protein
MVRGSHTDAPRGVRCRPEHDCRVVQQRGSGREWLVAAGLDVPALPWGQPFFDLDPDVQQVELAKLQSRLQEYAQPDGVVEMRSGPSSPRRSPRGARNSIRPDVAPARSPSRLLNAVPRTPDKGRPYGKFGVGGRSCAIPYRSLVAERCRQSVRRTRWEALTRW